MNILRRLDTFEKWALNMSRAEIGGLLKEYIAEANHNGWDGFDSKDLEGIRKFLMDMMVYHAADRLLAGETFAERINNTNPVK